MNFFKKRNYSKTKSQKKKFDSSFFVCKQKDKI